MWYKELQVLRMNVTCINELGVAIVGRDEERLALAASKLSNCTPAEIRRTWRTVEAELNSKDVIWIQSALSSECELIELSKPLSSQELEQKQVIENSFHDFLKSFVARGNDLIQLRDGKLYRNEYPNWETYCQFKLGISYRHAWRLIEAATVVNQLSDDDQLILPASESIAREIAKVKPVIRPLVWETVVAKSNFEDEPITAKFVTQVIEQLKEKKSTPSSQELTIGGLVEVCNKKTKYWGQITNLYNNQTCLVFDGSKEVKVNTGKVWRLTNNHITCMRIMKLYDFGNPLVNKLAATLHSVFYFEDWHLEIIKILEAQCNI